MRDQIASVLLNHWVFEVPNHRYPTFVKCMADGCDWEGRFPGDISEHNADLVMDLISARQPQRNSPTDWPNIPRAEA